MQLNLSIGTDQEIEKIHEASLRVLSEVGVCFHCEEAVEIFRKHGAKVENEIVYIDKKMVDNALKELPPRFKWHDVNGETVTIGDKVVRNLPAYGPIYVYKEGKYEKSSHEHLTNFHKLSETSPIMDASNPNVIDVSYIPGKERERYRLGVALKYCQKPLMGLVEGREVAEYSLETMRRFYGLDKLSNQVIAVGLIDTMGPMRISTAMCEALIAYAKNNQAVIICSGQTLGMTAPQSIAGVYMMGNSMILATIILSQLVNPGTPVVYSGKMNSDDMRLSSASAYGGIEGMLTSATTRRMADYYKIPLHTGNSNTDSKLIDYQSGAETFMNLFNAYMHRSECFVHSCGIMDSFNSIGYEKFILDEERVISLQRLLKGYEVSDEKFMFDRILSTGPVGQCFERTLPSYREDYFMPKLSIRDNHNNWIASGMPSAESLATEVWKKRLDEYVEPEHSKEQLNILKELLPKQYL